MNDKTPKNNSTDITATIDEGTRHIEMHDDGTPETWVCLVDGEPLPFVHSYSIETKGPSERPVVNARVHASRVDVHGKAQLVIDRRPLDGTIIGVVRDIAADVVAGRVIDADRLLVHLDATDAAAAATVRAAQRAAQDEAKVELSVRGKTTLVSRAKAVLNHLARGPLTLDSVVESIRVWQAVTFPKAPIGGIVAHLQKEVREVSTATERMVDVIARVAARERAKKPGGIVDPDVVRLDPEVIAARDALAAEFADVVFMVSAGFDVLGVDMTTAVRTKLDVNRARTWGRPDKDGVVEHVRDAE